MSKMSEIDIVLMDYEESLHELGHMDTKVRMLKEELFAYGLKDVNTLVEGIDDAFDTMVFNNQTEGRF
jgi:hypothetical protein